MKIHHHLTPFERRLINARLRSERLSAARKLGTHTKQEWEDLKTEFYNKCVKCGEQSDHLHKDHITPIYQGGSDSIENIQPLCGKCNLSKGPERFNWKEFRRLECPLSSEGGSITL